MVSWSLVPVVIVFTQYDRLYNQFSYDLAEELRNKDSMQRKERIEQESERYFHKNCIEQLKHIKYHPKRMKWVKVSSMDFKLFHRLLYLRIAGRQEHRQTLRTLTDITEELVRNHVRESAWVVMAAAQRVNADTKVKSCIACVLRCCHFFPLDVTLFLSCSVGMQSGYYLYWTPKYSDVFFRVLAWPRSRHIFC